MFRKTWSSELARLRSRRRRSRNDRESLNVFLHVQFPTFLNTNQLHLASFWLSKRANKKVTKDVDVLIQLILNCFRDVAITRNGESLLRNAEHPFGTNFPNPQRGSAIVNGQPAVNRKTFANQLWMLPAGFFLSFRCG